MRKILLVLLFMFSLNFALDAAVKTPANPKPQTNEPEAQQRMVGFSLAGYTQKGRKSWEIKGDSADIFSSIVKLTAINANVYGEEENINLVADKGDYDKNTGKMHLEKNVVITTDSGGKLTTDSLDWDRASQKVTTTDVVNIEKQNLKTKAQGLEGQPDLKKVVLKEDVHVQINPSIGAAGSAKDKDAAKGLNEQPPGITLRGKVPIIITCDGPLEVDYDKETAVFNKNVKVEQGDQEQIYADKMEVQFDFKNKTIVRIKSTGNVKITKGENISFCEEAVYSVAERKMILTGRPRLVIYSGEKLVNASSGN